MEKHKIFCKFLLRENNVTEVPHFSSIEKERERERESNPQLIGSLSIILTL